RYQRNEDGQQKRHCGDEGLPSIWLLKEKMKGNHSQNREKVRTRKNPQRKKDSGNKMAFCRFPIRKEEWRDQEEQQKRLRFEYGGVGHQRPIQNESNRAGNRYASAKKA